MLTIIERINRINNSSYIIRIEDSNVYVITDIQIYGTEVFVEASGGFLFYDLDVFTLEEAGEVEKILNKIKKLLIIK